MHFAPALAVYLFMNWTVWWYETDDFTGKTTCVYRDFATLREASEFQDMTTATTQIDRIEDCMWHHAHAAVLKHKPA